MIMSELKFRAWDLDYKWMENNFHINSIGIAHGEPSGFYDTANIEIEENPNLVVMQYTGVNDNKGVGLYDGDIVKTLHFMDQDDECHYLHFEIKWSDKFNGWAVIRSDGTEMQLWVFNKSVNGYFYVVGNIYENPELLESTNE